MSALVLPRSGAPGPAPRWFAFRAFANEADKGLRLMWRRRAVTITFVVLNGLNYLMIQFFIGGGHIVVPVLALTLPALFAVTVSSVAALQGSGGIAEEVNGGTLEQAHLSPAPPSLLVLGRLAALAAEGLITAAVLALVFGLGYGPHWAIRPDTLVSLALTVADALGYGLLMTALTLRVAEIQSGTIEQVYLSPLPSWVVTAAGRLAAAIIETLILMGVVYGIVSAFVTPHLHWSAAALVPMAFGMITGIGYSLIMAGMTLLWKRIQILMDVLLMLVMIFAVTALPVITVPGWFAGLGRLFPVTADVASLYGVMLGHRTILGQHGAGLWGTGGLAWVAVTAVAYLTAGLIVFRVLERATRVRGTLGAY